METGYLQKLKYTIDDVSSYVAGYNPQKILVNKPSDSNCRWSSDSNSHPQYVILKFEPAIVHAITFGKYEKSHTNNVKKFEIYGGLEPTSTIKLCNGTLRNDSVPETFSLRTTVGRERFPIAYLKIVPTQCWGSGFNYSIWYVELKGNCDKTAVLSGMNAVQMYRQHTAFRLCMKMFRELGMESCLDVLRQKATVPLEHPLLSLLHDVIVRDGNFSRAEELIMDAADREFLTDFVAVQPPVPLWTQIVPELGEPTPGMRGGHQMVLDPAGQMIYMFGGWDGTRDLSDFWQYDLQRKKWKIVSSETEQEGGPSPRSCHKMVIDSDNQIIYVIGRYVDQSVRTSDPLKNDFHMYDVLRKRWTVLSTDTFADGGPKLLFDHQIALDSEKKALYLFGGRVLEKKSDPGECITVAGLYVYDIPNNSWRCIQPDSKGSSLALRKCILQPRLGHCIIFHPGNRNLYVMGGHYNKEAVKDMVAYNVDSEECVLLGDAESGDTMPLGLTQRATLDLDLDEIYVYFGGGKSRDGSNTEGTQSILGSPNILWIFDIRSNKWSTCQNQKNTQGSTQKNEPSARYAHQLVYDSAHKQHYLFGGNASNTTATNKTRLDDFWRLQLMKPPSAEITRQIKYIIRKQCYRELCNDNPVAAVQYLRDDVATVLDKSSPADLDEFHQLPSLLFADQLAHIDDKTEISKKPSVHQLRAEVFSRICDFFPADMTPPRENLIDLVLP